MPRSRQYESAAERQAAYRGRVWQQAPPQKYLVGMAEGLHRDLMSALARGTSPLPAELLGAHAAETLLNLRDFISYGSLEEARKARQAF